MEELREICDLCFNVFYPRLSTALAFSIAVFYVHYANMSMHYVEILKAIKMIIFRLKKFDIFLIFAQNIDCWLHVTTASLRRF